MRGMRAGVCALALVLGCATTAAAQADAWAPSQQARPEDVVTIDGIVHAFYDVITGPAGQPRQWGRDSTLYLRGIRFTVIGRRARSLTHGEYAAASDTYMVHHGFYEREVHRDVHRFGNIAQVWSTYESRESANGPVTERGINALDLVFDGHRWWIAHAEWDQEGAGKPIPPGFLPPRRPRTSRPPRPRAP